ncbi:TlpA disulfide reductase family protein [Rhodoferax sp.]|uniref:TlpA disulfide reductase family protein n=1 Tax=Rhodoferax sp. TaxID=50421 RepID=UPI002ACE0B1A|nr:TlpA disulfide reductase family protein [Rhodoferax sp.]MDZ7918822.1 TlpA disulfide reductase family protein [Rhodoferax sp.]
MIEPPSSSQPASEASSRRWLLRGLAGGAALAGVGVAVWRGVGDTPAVAEPVAGFWGQRWETPDGKPLALQSFQGRPLLINFWATWCPPCVEELPLINQFFREHRTNGWQVLALAVDKTAPVQAFLQRMPLDFPVAMAGMSGADLGRSLGNLTGGLPFTVVLSGDGVVRQRKMGRVLPADLQAWAGLK